MDGVFHFLCSQSVAPPRRESAMCWALGGEGTPALDSGLGMQGGISCSGSLLSVDEEPSRMKALSLGNDLDSPGRPQAGR